MLCEKFYESTMMVITRCNCLVEDVSWLQTRNIYGSSKCNVGSSYAFRLLPRWIKVQRIVPYHWGSISGAQSATKKRSLNSSRCAVPMLLSRVGRHNPIGSSKSRKHIHTAILLPSPLRKCIHISSICDTWLSWVIYLSTLAILLSVFLPLQPSIHLSSIRLSARSTTQQRPPLFVALPTPYCPFLPQREREGSVQLQFCNASFLLINNNRPRSVRSSPQDEKQWAG